jgi:predicted ester cyclase
MATETNKALFRRFMEEVANRGNLGVIDEFMVPDFEEHEELPPGAPAGREGVRYFFREWRSGFPDGRVTLDLEIAEGDLVTCYETWQGTHTGTFLGIPPSGKRVLFRGIDIVRVADGKAVEHWGVSDMLSLQRQLGLIPAPDQVPAGT